MSLAEPLTSKPKPTGNRGAKRGPAFENNLPKGLSETTIDKIRRSAQKLARARNASFPVIFAAKIFSALGEQGFARLNAREVLALAARMNDMPDELAFVVVCFIANHPPLGADFPILQEAIVSGALGGVDGLVNLHRFIADRRRKAKAKLKHPWLEPLVAANRPPPQRPKLLSPRKREAAIRLERRNRADARRAEERAAQQTQTALAALIELYPIRHRGQPWEHEFISICHRLVDSGYSMTQTQERQLLDIAKERRGEVQANY